MMTVYDQILPMSVSMKQFKRGHRFAVAGEQVITDYMMISKKITLLIQRVGFIPDIKLWYWRTPTNKTWKNV